MQEDQSHVNRARDGDEQAFRLLVKTHQKMAYAVAIAVVKDHFVAEEVVQDAFVKVFLNLKKFRNQSSFTTWLYTIITNEARMRLRSQKNNMLDFSDTMELEQLPDPSNIPASALQEYMHRALTLLPSNEALALQLFYLEDSDLQTVSTITGWSVSNTKVILHRARKHIHIIIEQLRLKQIV